MKLAAPTRRRSTDHPAPRRARVPVGTRGARNRAALWFATGLTALLAGCAGSVSPPARLYQLRAEPPSSPAATPVAGNAVWQLGRVDVPGYLDRDTLLMPTGQAGLRPLSGNRWAEPLSDALPRLLRQDLARLMGADKVWGQPLPPGVRITQQLQVEIQRLDASPLGDAVVLQARWTLVDPLGKTNPRVDQAELRASLAGGVPAPTGSASAATADPDRLVAAHREVMWLLAQRIAVGAAGAAPADSTGSAPTR